MPPIRRELFGFWEEGWTTRGTEYGDKSCIPTKRCDCPPDRFLSVAGCSSLHPEYWQRNCHWWMSSGRGQPAWSWERGTEKVRIRWALFAATVTPPAKLPLWGVNCWSAVDRQSGASCWLRSPAGCSRGAASPSKCDFDKRRAVPGFFRHEVANLNEAGFIPEPYRELVRDRSGSPSRP